jgi:hypothetical protein
MAIKIKNKKIKNKEYVVIKLGKEWVINGQGVVR